ncbi:MAG: phosphate acyltransferase PlsX [Chloroflexi bacterium]|nr:phosphate acyltransferase PlsX [Chloroflexota bacterium]
MSLRIAVDAMGSDSCPAPDVAGAILAAKEFGDRIFIVGDEACIRPELVKHETKGLDLEVVHAPDIITMEDKPSAVGKDKPKSSMHVGMRLVHDGMADAFVTAGNTGAALAIATLYTLKRIPGVKRPALAGTIRLGDIAVTVLDVGANADSKPDWLAQFALMGETYARLSLKIDRPRVGLLSNGEEDGKGNDLVREAGALIRELPLNFVGNIEPRELLENGADVVVADGFVGNIMLKSLEAATRAMGNLIRSEIKRNPITTLGGALARPAFRSVYRQIDPFEVGGAPLLGINGVVIIGHGRSNQIAIKNAVGQARKTVLGKVIDAIASGLH